MPRFATAGEPWAKRTLQEREKELQALLATPAGREELQAPAPRIDREARAQAQRRILGQQEMRHLRRNGRRSQRRDVAVAELCAVLRTGAGRGAGGPVEQDDLVTAAGVTPDFVPPVGIRADQVLIGGVRLPLFKFPRNPEVR